MNLTHINRPLTRLLTIGMLLIGLIIPGVKLSSARADVSGNTYTSPQFGYSITWDNTWLVVEEESAEFDRVSLTNGISYASLMGGNGFSGNAQVATTLVAASLQTDSHISNFQSIESGGDATRYFTTVTYTYTGDDGSTGDYTDYYEARTLIPGEAIVLFNGSTTSLLFPIAKAGFDTLLSSLNIPGQATTSTTTTTTTTTAPPVVLEKGEPAPVFMAGPWRIGIVAAAQNTSITGIGLKEKDGKEWVTVVLDVTNWGSTDAAFPADEFFVRMQESPTKSKVATGSTAAAGRMLDLPTDPKVEIAVGSTTRLVLAFQVTAGRTSPSLVYGTESMPLDDLLGVAMDTKSLSAPAGPPELQAASLVSTADGVTIKVQYEGESKSRRVTLLGVRTLDTPDAIIADVSAHRGESVWIEEDPEVESGATPAVYLWLEDQDGNRVMLNQQLIASGAGRLDPSLPPEARFAMWLAQSATSEPSATPEPGATPSAAAPSSDQDFLALVGPSAPHIAGASMIVASQWTSQFSDADGILGQSLSDVRHFSIDRAAAIAALAG